MSLTNVEAKIVHADFIETASQLIQAGERPYTHAILNPPYKKIRLDSFYRVIMRTLIQETATSLYIYQGTYPLTPSSSSR